MPFSKLPEAEFYFSIQEFGKGGTNLDKHPGNESSHSNLKQGGRQPLKSRQNTTKRVIPYG